jgi:hypothetical protein
LDFQTTIFIHISILIKTKNMSKKSLLGFGFLIMLLSSVYFSACKKSGSVDTPAAPTCASKNIVVTATATAAASPTVSNGTITASATGSTGFTYSKDAVTFQASGNFSNLAAGSYTITAKDDAGCTKTTSVVVTATACPTITVTGTTTAATSAAATNGTITASATGSTGITYSKDGTNFQATGAFTSLGVGSYTITAKDANGCLGTAAFTISAASCPTITVTGTVTPASGPSTANGGITASATGGATPYQYSKDGTTFQTATAFSALPQGTYTITAKDANCCLGSASIIVTNSCPTITFTTNIIAADKCLTPATGSINVSANGSSGYTYSKDGTNFQAASLFSTLAAGNYPITVKDLNGCFVSSTVTVPLAPSGPNFLAVKAVLAANCAFAGCHAGASPQNGLDFTIDCTIVAQSARIKARAVDANPSVMPPTGAISAADKTKITNWISAGGGNSN